MNAQTAPRTPQQDWQSLSSTLGVDQEEIGMVASRYQSYREFMTSRGGGMDLDAWFRFYLYEKQSETGYQSGAPVSGCSAQGEASGQSSVANPAAFLQVLKQYLHEAG